MFTLIFFIVFLPISFVFIALLCEFLPRVFPWLEYSYFPEHQKSLIDQDQGDAWLDLYESRHGSLKQTEVHNETK
jgi:hypothetical protein